MPFDLTRAIAQAERRERLLDAEQNAQWVIRRSKMLRIKSKTERETVVRDALSCLHGVSYTMPCVKCKRDKQESMQHLNRLKAKLSIT
jgi:hypothetical protein